MLHSLRCRYFALYACSTSALRKIAAPQSSRFLFSGSGTNSFVRFCPNVAFFSNEAAAVDGNLSKTALMRLRKRTGYSISKCKQAVVQFGENLDQAEEWLKETARKEGWEKITKRADVTATHGLLGLFVNSGTAAISELNCQTDFVARNETFRALVGRVTKGIYDDVLRSRRMEQGEISSKWNLSVEQLSENEHGFGSTLPNMIADMVGHVGEKVAVNGAFIMRVAPDINLVGYVHPRSDENVIDGVATGHFAALVAFRMGSGSKVSAQEVGTKLCQHIVGMNPSGIGLPPAPPKADVVEEEKPAPPITETKAENSAQEETEEDDTHIDPNDLTKLSNETTLLRQDFMLDPEITVYDYLRENDATIVDFVRIERGTISANHFKKVE